MKRLIILSVVLGAGAMSITLRAQPDPTAIAIRKVQDTLYVITGGRPVGTQTGVAGNTTVFIGDGGVVLVDTKYVGLGKSILDQVKSVTSKPVTTVINTHTHGDHTGGNAEFPRAVEFVAQENTRANMTRMDEFKGDNAAFLPKKTFKDRLSLGAGKDRMELYYFGRGHTDGDTIIVFPALRTAVFGDLFARKWAPLVDAGNGGSATEFPKTLAKAASTIKDVDTVITGHATTTIASGSSVNYIPSTPLMSWSGVHEYAEFLRDFVAAAEAAKKAGVSVDAAAGQLKLPAKYKDYNMAQARADVQRVYEETK